MIKGIFITALIYMVLSIMILGGWSFKMYQDIKLNNIKLSEYKGGNHDY